MFIFLKNIIRKELDVNRHIHAKRTTQDSNSENINNPTIESATRNLKGLKRNAWVSSSFLMLLLLVIPSSNNILSTIMMSLLLVLVLLTIYTNSHNIINHQRWLNGKTLLDKKEFLRVFMSQPHLVLAKTLSTQTKKPKKKKKGAREK